MDELLSEWNISQEEARQSEKLATLTIVMKYPSTEGFMEIPPAERKIIIRQILQQQYARLKKEFRLKNIALSKLKTEPRILEAQIALKDLFQLKEKDYVQNVIVKEIEGVLRKELKEEKNKETVYFYAVKARYAILIEGRNKGWQTYEDRIVLLKGKSYEEVEEKALEILPKQEKPYLNSDKRYVWYKFEEIIDISETYARDLNDLNTDGIEIYSQRKDRRMKPGDEWILPYRTKE